MDMNKETSHVVFKCLPVTQPIGTFYIGSISSSDLVDIAWTDVRRIAGDADGGLESDNGVGGSSQLASGWLEEPVIEEMDNVFLRADNRDFEGFLGIQRQLSTSRVREIRQYVRTQDAAFPTSVLIAVSSLDATYDDRNSIMSIRRHSRAAKVIDGQHRIAGLEEYEGPQFDVNVSVFIDMDIQDQAMVFATINLKQTKVNRSLAYDLYAFTKTRSPQRSSHDIVRFLNYKDGSPFYYKIKMLGTGSGKDQETITQATFVDRLLRYITRDPMNDRDALRRGKKLNRARDNEERWLIFRNWFVNEEDVKIAIVLWNYFSAVRSRWPTAWDEVIRGNILNRTTGFGALMRFMRLAYNSRNEREATIGIDEFKEIFANIELDDTDFKPEEFVPGSSGERKLFDLLVEQSGLETYR